MTVGIDLTSLTQHSTGFPLNATEWNSRLTELDTAFQTNTKDFAIRQIVLSMNTGENITAGDFVYVSGATILKTDDSDTARKGFLGCALETITTGNPCRVAVNAVYGLSSLTAGANYYLSATSGQITSTPPNTYSKAIGYALNTTTLFIKNVENENPVFNTLEVSGQALFSDGSAGSPSITNTGDLNTGIFFPAADTYAISTGGTEALRVDSSQNVGIGTASPSHRLDVDDATNRSLTSAGAQFKIGGLGFGGFFALDGTSFQIGQNSATRSLTFHSGSGMLERMRIDSDGKVGIGTASPNSILGLDVTGDNTGLGFQIGSTTYGGITIASSSSPNRRMNLLGIDGFEFYKDTVDQGTATSVMKIDESGNVFMTALNTGLTGNPVHITSSGELWENTSSKRFKTNIKPIVSIDSSLIFNLNPVEYDRIDSNTGTEIPNTHEIGFIAEEVQEILPIAVNYDRKVKSNDPNIPRGVDKTIFIPLIISEMKKLRDRVAALESS